MFLKIRFVIIITVKSPNIFTLILYEIRVFSNNLFTEEKFEIMFNPQTASQNSRQEMFAACRHKWAALIIKKKRKKKTFVGS